MTKRDRPRIAPTLAPPSATDPVDVLLAPEPPAPPAPPAKRRRFRPLRWLFVLFLVAMLAPPAIVLPLRWYPPPTTAFMLRSEVQMAKNFTLEQWEMDKGFVLTCQARPLTPHVVVSYDER